jgi:hypothetical protein
MPRVAVAVVATAVLGACGGDDSTVTVTDTATDGKAPGPPATTSTTNADTTTTTGGDGATPPADRTVDELTAFSSPTGNIGCYIDLRSVRCDIGDRDWEPPPTPPGCEVCESEESGMTCTDTETGRGFTIAIEGYDIF